MPNSADRLRDALREFIRDERGQDLIEYALVAGLIGLGTMVAMSGLATKIKSSFNTVGNVVTNSV